MNRPHKVKPICKQINKYVLHAIKGFPKSMVGGNLYKSHSFWVATLCFRRSLSNMFKNYYRFLSPLPKFMHTTRDFGFVSHPSILHTRTSLMKLRQSSWRSSNTSSFVVRNLHNSSKFRKKRAHTHLMTLRRCRNMWI